jgi:molybdopterin/thiamine biosynthesis adenylyltransferase
MATETETELIMETYDSETWYEAITDRNLGIISRDEQKRISEILIVQAGVGGNSGIPITLAQMGFQKFRLADPDTFNLTNFNRQLGANILTLNRNKAEVIAEEIQRLNPDAKVEVYPEGVTKENMREFLKDADIVIDAVDDFLIKPEIFKVAEENKQPVVTCPVLGWGAAIAIFDPETSSTFEETFGLPPDDIKSPEGTRYTMNFIMQFLSSRPEGVDIKLGKERNAIGRPPSVAVACRLNAALVPCAIYRYLFDKGSMPVMPTCMHFDILGAKLGKTGPKKRWLLNKAVGLLAREEDA